MDLTQRLRAWTYGRQQLGRRAPTAAQALFSVVAVYSAHPTAPLALLARTSGMSGDDFRALETERAALRIPGMRGSLFLAPRELAARVFVPGRLNAAKLATRLGRGDLTEDQYAATADRVVAAAVEPLLPNELETIAGVKGIAMSMLLRTIRGEGRLLAVADRPLRSARLRYVATDSWAPGSLDGEDSDDGFAALAGDYLAAYGPARVADFAWWMGIGRGVASRAVAGLETTDVGAGLLLPAKDEAGFASVEALEGTVDLLPKWDPYTMGYAPDGRARLVQPDNQRRIYVQKGIVAPGQPNIGLPGDGYPVVLVDGEAAGTWNLTVKGATVNLFGRIDAETKRKVDDRLAAAEAFLSG